MLTLTLDVCILTSPQPFPCHRPSVSGLCYREPAVINLLPMLLFLKVLEACFFYTTTVMNVILSFLDYELLDDCWVLYITTNPKGRK